MTLLLCYDILGIDGWRDLTPASSTQSLISKQLPQGGSTILECQPHLNRPLPTSVAVSWLRDQVPILDSDSYQQKLDKWTLLIQNFSLPNKKDIQYKCIVEGLPNFHMEFNRTFSLTLSEGTICMSECVV